MKQARLSPLPLYLPYTPAPQMYFTSEGWRPLEPQAVPAVIQLLPEMQTEDEVLFVEANSGSSSSCRG